MEETVLNVVWKMNGVEMELLMGMKFVMDLMIPVMNDENVLHCVYVCNILFLVHAEIDMGNVYMMPRECEKL